MDVVHGINHVFSEHKNIKIRFTTRPMYCINSLVVLFFDSTVSSSATILQKEAFEKCWAHSPLRAAAHSLF